MKYTLRKWTNADLDSLVKYANNAEIANNLTDKFPYPYTVEAGQRFINFATDESASHCIFAIDINGEACGGIGLHPQSDVSRKNAEIGYWLGEPFWGNGIITQAINEIIPYGFANLDIDRVFARPFGSNSASIRVLNKTGFVLEGTFKNTFIKNGQYQDELIYAIRKTMLK